MGKSICQFFSCFIIYFAFNIKLTVCFSPTSNKTEIAMEDLIIEELKDIIINIESSLVNIEH
jgi:hypothetical protein